MKKVFFLYSGLVVVILSILSFQNSVDVAKCVRIKCGKKIKYVRITGVDEVDIANQIKLNYDNCSFEYVEPRKCKNP